MASFTSILQAESDDVTGVETPPDCLVDLHLDHIITAVTSGHRDVDLDGFFRRPLRDVAAVEFRQQVFRDLDKPGIRRPVQNFVHAMGTVRSRIHIARNVWHPLQRQGWLIAAVETYCRTVVQLRDDLAHLHPNSVGLHKFSEHIANYAGSEAFATLLAEAETVRGALDKVRYLVHIQGLKVHVEKFDMQPDYTSEVTRTFERFATEVSHDYHVALADVQDMNHVEEQILECVAHLHPEAFALLDQFCLRHEQFIEPAIARFEREIQFYLTYLALVGRVTEAGLPFAYARVTHQAGTMQAKGAFDLALAINAVQEEGKPVIGNDFHLSDSERIFVITGPNQGGKTTLARTIGQCAYLASLGCPVPARSATITLPDQIYTHFERQEDLSTFHGKLDNELVRIHDILSRATATSMIIMNESFSSTTANDAVLIGSEVLQRIIHLRCIAVCVSFLDELSTLDPSCVSMVGEVAHDDPTKRTYKFTRRPADGLAYAAALAGKYGLGHDALRKRISQ